MKRIRIKAKPVKRHTLFPRYRIGAVTHSIDASRVTKKEE